MSKWKSVKDDPPTGNMGRYVWVRYHSGYLELLTARTIDCDSGSPPYWAEVASGVPPEWEEPTPELVKVEGSKSQDISKRHSGFWEAWSTAGLLETETGMNLSIRHLDPRKAILLFNAVAKTYNRALKEIQ